VPRLTARVLGEVFEIVQRGAYPKNPLALHEGNI
jgi:hypothetical protein